jgi:hypothetical protein
MKNRWAQGIEPRYFTWVLKDALAVSERPGGYSRNHRRVRRHEEILWLRQEGFTRIVSLLPTSHNLHAYEELDVVSSHLPFSNDDDPRTALPPIYAALQKWLDAGDRVLLHREELGDEVMGFIAGYLMWSGRIPTPTQAVTVVEQLFQKQMGPSGRKIVAAHESWQMPPVSE